MSYLIPDPYNNLELKQLFFSSVSLGQIIGISFRVTKALIIVL